MTIKPTKGLLKGAQFIPSPNFDERPDNTEINLLVIHNISLPPNEFGGPYVKQFFCNQLNSDEHPFFSEIKDLKVSSHLLIQRDGSIVQFVPFHKRAWHAGESVFREQVNCNDFSIGIELEGTDFSEYEDVQYIKLAKVTLQLMMLYPGIDQENIVGHCHIAPDRKTDPGPAFDWNKYRKLLRLYSVVKFKIDSGRQILKNKTPIKVRFFW